jgi:predicted nucleic acid-binding protein
LIVAYLLDTNVVSELRKLAPNPLVLAWHQSHKRSEAYVSVLVVGEIRQGIERVRPRDPKQADALERWLVGLLSSYRERILPVTADVAQEWGRLNASPQSPPVIDGLVAATAKVHRLTLVTRNVANVANTGVAVINPFEPG